MVNDKDDWNYNFNKEEEIMMWATLSNIYFDNYENIDNFKDLRKKYVELWDNPNLKPIIKRAIKYFYLFRKAVLEKGDVGGLLFESRRSLSFDEIEFYRKYISNPLSRHLLNRIVESNNPLTFQDNIILHLGAGNYLPPKYYK